MSEAEGGGPFANPPEGGGAKKSPPLPPLPPFGRVPNAVFWPFLGDFWPFFSGALRAPVSGAIFEPF